MYCTVLYIDSFDHISFKSVEWNKKNTKILFQKKYDEFFIDYII
jgi:hypothetical protein